ncbi:MAG: Stp1/IreP family PP2C-type Ser/Thr phosphatase [Undibacterium sp.]|nr:Stp1/IreP family PP2C-type Ser/Thr phosphatase [Undibacterium sp.]
MSFQTVLEFASLSDTGLVRAHNEDAIETSQEIGLAILADGMGGYNAGEVASRMSVELISKHIKQKQQSAWIPLLSRQTLVASRWINDAISYANERVLAAAHEHAEYVGMGTTIVVAMCHQDKLLVAHVGDSRVYRYRRGELKQITRDHSVLQAQIDAGLITEEQAQFSPIKNLITRAIGAQVDIEVEIHDHQLEEGDIYLLCSDGLTDMLKYDQIHTIMKQHCTQLDLCCQTLINGANNSGGRDNISVILLKVNALQQRKLMDIFAS